MQSAAAVVKLTEQLTPERAAHALNYDGEEPAW
jgi:hypothetical protein